MISTLAPILGVAFFVPGAWAEGGVINACVNAHSGIIRVIPDGASCNQGWIPIQITRSGIGDSPPPTSATTIQYITQGMYPGTSVARAFCPSGSRVTGGGGISVSGTGLQQSYPISDTSGVIAYGTNAIGWQVAASDWSDVQAFVICVSP